MDEDMEILILLWLAGVVILIWWQYKQTLRLLWLEPVFRNPVLIIESDDWGPGPDIHAERLNRLVEILSAHQDSRGRHPMMTLGVVLAVPDTHRIRQENLRHYYRLYLANPRFDRIHETMQAGVASRVFAIQLHGMEHFWPPSVLAAARTDSNLRDWLTGNELPDTEDLPSHLQSRWTDCSSLPSSPIPKDGIETAAKEEVEAFRAVFGYKPRVAVPPTFVWNEVVERAWYSAGVRVVVTSGQRYERRGQDGRLQAISSSLRNGQMSPAGVMYIVRNGYFEPAMGHTAQLVLETIDRNRKTARPTLLETHRFNFTGEPDVAESAYQELETLFAEALALYPDLAFMSTEELAKGLSKSVPSLVETRTKRRIHVWLQRLREIPRVRKLAWLSGLIIPAFIFFLATAKRESHTICTPDLPERTQIR